MSNILQRTGRQMDQAWKDAISRGLKASGKIQHTVAKTVNTAKVGGAIAATAAPVAIGSAIGTVKGAAKGVSGVLKTAKAFKSTKGLGKALVAGAKIGGAVGGTVGLAKSAKPAFKIARVVKPSKKTMKNSYFNR